MESDKYSMVILDDYQRVALELADWDRLADFVEVQVLAEHCDSEETLIQKLFQFDIIFAMRERTPLTGDMIEKLPNLKLIVTAGPLNAAIAVKKAREKGIPVCGTGFTSYSTVELTWSLILFVSRNIYAEVEAMRSGGWQVGLGEDLHGKTLGIIGLGNSGKRVAKIASAFGMNIIAWSQNMTQEIAVKHGARLVDKDTLFREADVVTIHLRLSDRTRGLVGEKELSIMKPSAILVNTSRGPLVDEQALQKALEKNKIAGAGLDVYDVEPLPVDHPFRKLSNVITTPHLGYVSRDLYRIFLSRQLKTCWPGSRVNL